MSTPQAGIFSDPSPYHYFLEFRVPERADLEVIRETLRQLLAWAPAGTDARECHRVVGFGLSMWERFDADELPGLLRPFSAIEGPEGKSAPATQNDLWVWLHGPRHDLNFSLAMYASSLLNGEAMLRLEQPGFSYLDGRDLTGFIDGTANPSGEEAKKVALIPQGLAGEGGSYVLAMRWV
ncbi:MAG: Dyp-type peroxidase, partial [SAR324 cluster bacterium]|nr:Dyp-type peroxidase [SAR324 cluster bacterium]